MAFNAYSSRNAQVRYGSGPTTLTSKSWDVTPKADKLETTNFEGSGYAEFIAGVRQCDVQIQFSDNGAANPFDGGLTAGSIISNLKLYLNTTAGPYWLFPSFFVESVSMKADVKEQMMDSLTGSGTGTFTYPTGNAGTTS